jgi:acyl-CoA reductase-like NAD-dependent aldehyde dehydrogenase
MLRKWNDLCLENLDDLALILTLENGKTLAETKGEVTMRLPSLNGLLEKPRGHTA